MSLIPFSARSYRSGSPSGSVRRFGSSRVGRPARITVASTNMGQWIAQQHEEVLAARDLEALEKLAQGGTQGFIDFALERIAAYGGDEVTQDRWERLLGVAVEAARKRQELEAKRLKTESDRVYMQEIRLNAVMLEAGEISGEEFLSLLSAEMNRLDPSDERYLFLAEQYVDAKKWVEMTTRALEKRHDEELAAGIAAGEIPLEAALTYLTDRRSRVKPGDEAYGNLTKQIADVKNAISARDFNAELQEAHSKLVDSGNSKAGKETYLGKLVELMHRARTSEAQGKLFEQAKKVQEAIQKDEVLELAQQVNKMVVDYYDPRKGTTATQVLDFLSKKALETTDEGLGERLVTLAKQIQDHERQKAQRAAAAMNGAGPGLTSAAINRRIADFEDSYKDAVQLVSKKIENEQDMSDADWSILRNARDAYLSIIDEAKRVANADARRTLNNTERSVLNESGQPDEGAPNGGWDFGDLGRKFGAQLVADVKDRKAAFTDEIKAIKSRGDDPDELASAIVRRSHEIADALNAPGSQFLTEGQRKELEAINADVRRTLQQEITDATAVVSGVKRSSAAAWVDKEYADYRERFKQNPRNKGMQPLTQDEWRLALLGPKESGGLRIRQELSRPVVYGPDGAPDFEKGGIGVQVTDDWLATRRTKSIEDRQSLEAASRRLMEMTAYRDEKGRKLPKQDLPEDVSLSWDQALYGNAPFPKLLSPEAYAAPGGEIAQAPVAGRFAGHAGLRPGENRALDLLAGQTRGPLSTFLAPEEFGQQPTAPAPAAAPPQPTMPAFDAMQPALTEFEGGQTGFGVADLGAGSYVGGDMPSAFGRRGGSTGGGFSMQPEEIWNSAWSFLTEPVAFELPSFVLPDLPPEPAFMLPSLPTSTDFGFTEFEGGFSYRPHERPLPPAPFMGSAGAEAIAGPLIAE